ncbi:hypothetical protein ACQ4PT_021649 [Festuca glaucescens]
MLGPRFGDNFIYLLAVGTKGGVLLACSEDFQITEEPLAPGTSYSITGHIVNRTDHSSWSITGVYGPQEDDLKVNFLQELRQLRNVVQDKWMVLGDFNLICRADEKSNQRLNLRMMGRFRAWIQDMELIEYPLFGRRFTWSSERQNCTHTRIDRVFVSKEWDLEFPQFQLAPASTNVSDHCPIVLRKMDVKHYKGFRFEAHWLRQEGFLDSVKKAWEKQVMSRDPVRVLHTKLSRCSMALKQWHRSKVKWTKFVSAVADDVIFNFDVAQEERQLTSEECKLRVFLKSKLLGITAVDRCRWRQRSRVTWIRQGDANTRFFHLRANRRRRKNHIPSLEDPNGEVNTHDGKAKILLDHFKELMGTASSASVELNWDQIGVLTFDLHYLDEPFSMNELKQAIDGYDAYGFWTEMAGYHLHPFGHFKFKDYAQWMSREDFLPSSRAAARGPSVPHVIYSRNGALAKVVSAGN